MLCEGKIGCHYCLNFLQILEAKMERVFTEPEKEKPISDVLDLIKKFRKGEKT